MVDFELKVTPDELREIASKYNNCVEQIESEWWTVDDRATRTISRWEGDACNAYKKYFELCQNEMKRLSGCLKEYSESLLQMAGIYEQTEEQLVEVGMTLPSDVLE